MKKVRMAIGAAVPAAGMLIAPATAAHAATTTAGNAAATTHPSRTGIAAFTCPPASHASTNASTHGELFFFISAHGSCVNFQQATLTHRQTGLTERVRF